MSPLSEQPGVATATRSGTRIAVTVAALFLLGLAAYGFGFSLSQPQLVNHPFVPVGNGSNAPSIIAAICNDAPSATGGGGRCYPGCTKDADCANTSSWTVCSTFAVSVCNGSATCIAQICGPQSSVCFQGFCTRPNLALTKTQCAAPSAPVPTTATTTTTAPPLPGAWIGLCPTTTPAAGAPIANCTQTDVTLCRGGNGTPTTGGNVNRNTNTNTNTPTTSVTCLFQPGRCNQGCTKDSDCPAPVTATCIAQAKAQCTNAAGVLDQNCNSQAIAICMRPDKCTIPTGSTVGHCGQATTATTVVQCPPPTTPTSVTSGIVGAPVGTTIWTGFCSNNPTWECRTTTDCLPMGS